MSRRLILAAGAAAALAAGAAAAWLAFLRDAPEPVSVREAVETYRQAGTGGAAPIPPGVYVYATRGFERTDALTGALHRYPRRSTITVTRHPCGARLRWDVLRGRSTVWTVCLRAGRLSVLGQDERHSFFGAVERTVYACRRAWLRLDRPGGRAPVACATKRARERGALQVAGAALLRVGGRQVRVAHVRKRTRLEGTIRGVAVHDLWLARPSGLPVRLRLVSRTANDSPIGEVRYEEEVELRLLSLTPRR